MTDPEEFHAHFRLALESARSKSPEVETLRRDLAGMRMLWTAERAAKDEAYWALWKHGLHLPQCPGGRECWCGLALNSYLSEAPGAS